MVLKGTQKYTTELQLNNIKLAYVGEIKFSVDLEVASEVTNDGVLKASNPCPGCSLDVTKYTKHEAVSEQAFEEALWSLLEEPGRITVINHKKSGTYTLRLYNVTLSSYDLTDTPGELFNRELSFEAEDFEYEWV